jgi:hypothetical protein
VRKVKDTAQPRGLDRATDYCGHDQYDQQVWRLKAPRIIRRAIANPASASQGFYYNLLLQHIAFRDEAELLPADGNYFVECIRKHLFTTSDALDQHLQRHAQYNLWGSVMLEKLRANVTTAALAAAAEALGTPNEENDTNSANVLLAGAAAWESMQEAAGEVDPEEAEQALPLPAGMHNRYQGDNGHPTGMAAANVLDTCTFDQIPQATAHKCQAPPTLLLKHLLAPYVRAGDPGIIAAMAAAAVQTAAANPQPQPLHRGSQQQEQQQQRQQQERAARDPIADLHAAILQGSVPDIAGPQQDTLAEVNHAAMHSLKPKLIGQRALTTTELGQEQRDVVAAVLATLDNAGGTCTTGAGTLSAMPAILTLQGGPGCGKSAVTRHIIEQVQLKCRANVLVTATTATTAQRLQVSHSDTVHAACQVPGFGNLTPMYPLNIQTAALRMADIVICDEFSMLTSKVLGIILHRMAQATHEGSHRKVLLLVGDVGQLPPICKHGRRPPRGGEAAPSEPQQPGLCPTCHLLRNAHYQAGPAPAADTGLQASSRHAVHGVPERGPVGSANGSTPARGAGQVVQTRGQSAAADGHQRNSPVHPQRRRHSAQQHRTAMAQPAR